ncbi:ankyrin repeat domain-containing protein [Luteitalea pratensis]|uniref:ankyrin repeat domain-containing protein n=1 Tax=Luteitalea pratensis TaxID=1855912 RepID=UPI000D730CA3
MCDLLSRVRSPRDGHADAIAEKAVRNVATNVGQPRGHPTQQAAIIQALGLALSNPDDPAGTRSVQASGSVSVNERSGTSAGSQTCNQGRRPLFSAATAGWAPEQSVKILLEHGADPHIRNDDGRTAFEEVLMHPTARCERVAKLLQGNPARASR